MISNEYGMSCDLQSAIALYVAGKLFVKVKESDDIESIDASSAINLDNSGNSTS